MSEVYTTSIVGPDGSGKTTTVDTVARMLGKSYSVGVLASLRNPSYVIHGENQKLLFPTLTSKVAMLYEKGQDRNPLALFASFLSYIAMQGRLIEPHIVKNYHPDVLLQDRHRVVDSIIMFRHYGMRNVPINIMTSAVETVGGKSVTDDLILLTISPEIAHRRSRRKKSDNHESLETIKEMAALYPTVISSLVQMGRIKNWTSFDTETLNQNIVANNVYTRITGNKMAK